TLPHQLSPLALQNKKVLYDLLFRASAETLLQVAADPKHLGAEIGFLSVLHTCGQNLLHHPHLHCVIPAGGISPDRTRWIHPRYPFFLPVHVLSRVFRGKFVAGLKRRFQQHQLTFAGSLQPLAHEKAFHSFLRPLFRQDWVVYAKPPFGGPHHVLGYLARYTHRVAITNHRLVAFEHDQLTFRWKDYAHGNKKRMMTLGAQEFLRRFLLHVLPRGFVRIRSFGFLANRHRATLLSLCQRLLLDHPRPATYFWLQTSPRYSLLLAKTQAIVTYYSTFASPRAKDLRIGQAKPIAPPRPPQTPAASSKSPYRKCVGGTHLWTHAAARRRRICDRELRFNANLRREHQRAVPRARATFGKLCRHCTRLAIVLRFNICGENQRIRSGR